MRGLLRHQIHLALVAAEVEAEAAAVTEAEVQRLMPLRFPATTTDTEAELVTDAVTALHDDRLLRFLRLQGRSDLFYSMLLIERTSGMVRHII